MAWFQTAAEIGTGILLPLVLLACGIFFTVYLRGFFFFRPLRMLSLLTARKKKGGVSPWRALSVSLAGTLGVGNLVGVAVALILGGAGAMFWMWISALFSMVLKYGEIVLAMRRRRFEGGRPLGGPMYYMRDGIGGRLGKMLAILFSGLGLVSSFFMGNMVQTNAAADAASATLRMPKLLFGVIAAILTAVVIFGGFRGISRVTSLLIPLMSGLYLLLSLRIVFAEGSRLPAVMQEILNGAFSPSAAGGGITGALLSGALRQGIAKGCFTHEAGCGTAPMAHIESDSDCPAAQGVLGIFEVFFDTIVMCTLTGFVILLTDGLSVTENGMHLLIYAFSRYYGKTAAYFISFSILIFAFATVICWAHYGKTCLAYFTSSNKAMRPYLLIYAVATLLGAVLPQGIAWELSDLFVAMMTVLNLPSLVFLRREIREETFHAGLIGGQRPLEDRFSLSRRQQKGGYAP